MATTNLNFSVLESGNCKTLVIADTSTYSSSMISQPTLTIHIPGVKNPVLFDFIPKVINVINSTNLGITCSEDSTELSDIPDGVYKIKYTIKPSATYYVEKYFMRACKLQCKFESAILKLDISNCDDPIKGKKIDLLKEVEFMILSSLAAADTGNIELAVKLYREAEHELNKFLERY